MSLSDRIKMIVKAKFYVSKVSEFGSSDGRRQEISKCNGNDAVYIPTGIPIREITLQAVYDNGNKENQSFSEFTPNGQITFTLNNPNCADEFKVGEEYYVEFKRKDESK